MQDGYTLTNCVKNYDFSNGVPPSADINDNNISLSVTGGSLLCTMNNNYATSGINPKFGANLTAGMTYQIEFDFDPGNLTLNDQLYAVPFDYNGSFALGNYFFTAGAVPPAGHYSFAYTPAFTGPSWASYLAFNTNGTSNHWFKVDNVKMCSAATAVSPGVVNSYSPDVLSNTDYYPFGQEMPGRKWRGTADRYRYGMNGQEKDDEIANGLYTAEYWEYDSRIGRRWNIDPIDYPWQSPYACFNNNPIYFADPLGLEGDPPTKGQTRTNSDGTVDTYNGTDWQKTTVGQAQSPDHAIQLPEFEIGSNGSTTTTRTENAAMANIDNSTRAGEPNYSFEYNPNYKPTPQQQAWYSLSDNFPKMAGAAVVIPFVAEPLAVAAVEELAGVPLWTTLGGGLAKSVVKEGVKDVLTNPKSLWGKSAEEIAKNFADEGYNTVLKQSTKGSQKATIVVITDHKVIQQIQVHPGGGRHGGGYIKISTTDQGIIKVVDKATYKPTPGEKAKIIYKD